MAVAVTFSTVKAAESCVLDMDGRAFDGLTLSSLVADLNVVRVPSVYRRRRNPAIA